MICRCCGRRTAPRAGPATRIVKFFRVGAQEQWISDGLQATFGGVLVAEVLCWRCFAWGDEESPAFGKLYTAR